MIDAMKVFESIGKDAEVEFDAANAKCNAADAKRNAADAECKAADAECKAADAKRNAADAECKAADAKRNAADAKRKAAQAAQAAIASIASNASNASNASIPNIPSKDVCETAPQASSPVGWWSGKLQLALPVMDVVPPEVKISDAPAVAPPEVKISDAPAVVPPEVKISDAPAVAPPEVKISDTPTELPFIPVGKVRKPKKVSEPKIECFTLVFNSEWQKEDKKQPTTDEEAGPMCMSILKRDFGAQVEVLYIDEVRSAYNEDGWRVKFIINAKDLEYFDLLPKTGKKVWKLRCGRTFSEWGAK